MVNNFAPDWPVEIKQHVSVWAGKRRESFVVYHGGFIVASRPTLRGAQRIVANLKKEIAQEALTQGVQ